MTPKASRARSKSDDASKAARDAAEAVKTPLGAADNQPTIQIVAGEIQRVVDEAEAALIAADLGLYQREGKIVHIANTPIVTAGGHKVVGQRIVERGENALAEDLAAAARFMKFSKGDKEWTVADPPPWVAKTLRQRVGRLRLPILTGIVNAPTLRENGSLIERPGYDKETGLFFDPLGVEFPPIERRPSRRAAEAALRQLDDLISTFPFVDKIDRAVALSGILSALARRSIPTCPLFAYTATQAGSGKSKLVDIASVIATGHEAGVISQGASEEELEKRLGAALMAGDPVVAIDNCESELGGEFLCAMLTQKRVKPRILGRSAVPEISSNTFASATGNNLVLTGDLTRRAVMCRLDAKCDRPENRSFDREPVAYAKKHRASLVVAGLTVLRAYIAAGRPGGGVPLGSFEEWSRLVRDALTWLGCEDPVESMEFLRKADPKRVELLDVAGHWREIIGGEKVTVAEVINIANERAEHAPFRDALLLVTNTKGSINAVSLGKWLSKRAGQVVDGYRFEQRGIKQKTVQWALVKMG